MNKQNNINKHSTNKRIHMHASTTKGAAHSAARWWRRRGGPPPPRPAASTTRPFSTSKAQGKITHPRKHKSEIPLENANEHPLEHPSENPLERWNYVGTCHWTNIGNYHWKSTMISEVLISGVQSFAPTGQFHTSSANMTFINGVTEVTIYFMVDFTINLIITGCGGLCDGMCQARQRSRHDAWTHHVWRCVYIYIYIYIYI